MTLDRRLSLTAIAVGLLLRLYLGLTAEGYYFPDEVFQYLEPGHLLAFGRGTLCWEYEYGMRSWILPTILGGMMRTFDMLGIHHTDVYWRIFRVLAGLMSILVVIAADRMGRRIGGKWVGVTSALMTAIYVPLLDLSPRLLVDSLCGTLTVWALARVFADEPSESDCRWSGGVFAIAAVFRLASGVAIVPPFVALVLRRDWRKLIAFSLPMAAIFIFSGVVDWMTWGRPFHSWITYVDMNFIRGVSESFGTAPADAYLTMILRTFDGIYLVALAAIILGFRKSGLVGLTVIITYLFMSAAGHKEFRFTAGILPLVLVLLAHGLFVIADMFDVAPRIRRIGLAGAIAVFAMQNLNEIEDQDWGLGKIEQRMVIYTQRMPDVHGVFITSGRFLPAGEWMAHRNGPTMYIISQELAQQNFIAAAHFEMMDTIIADADGVDGLRAAGLNIDTLRAVHKDGPWTIYRRTPSQSVTPPPDEALP